MNGGLPPRAVVVTRPTDYEELLYRHATREQARFFLESRKQSIGVVEEKHRKVRAAVDAVLAGIPPRWRRALVSRGDLDRFLFEPEDVVVAVGTGSELRFQPVPDQEFAGWPFAVSIAFGVLPPRSAKLAAAVATFAALKVNGGGNVVFPKAQLAMVRFGVHAGGGGALLTVRIADASSPVSVVSMNR